MFERIEVALVAVIPPMELDEVEAFHAHSRERDADRILDDAPGHPARTRNPLCKRLNFLESLSPMTSGELAPEGSNKVLGRAVMVGEVPSCEPSVVIGEHLIHRATGGDGAMCAGDLPHSVEDTADVEIGGELEATRSG